MTLPPRSLNASRFKCPHCGAFAQQSWLAVGTAPHPTSGTLAVAVCAACNKYSLWVKENDNVSGQMVWPDDVDVPPPNPDLVDEIAADYNEAASILNKSSRGAAALLRLCIQKLCIELELPGQNLNTDIASLVAKGLPVKVQQSLDAVRVIGNESVHPGQMDMTDDTATARALFGLVNLIADSLISNPKQAEEIYKSLPPSKLAQIEARDS